MSAPAPLRLTLFGTSPRKRVEERPLHDPVPPPRSGGGVSSADGGGNEPGKRGGHS